MNEEHHFHNNLKVLRKQEGLRQIDVAERLGHTSADRISHWEKGLAVPGLVNLFKLSLIYKVAPQELYAELHSTIAQNLKERGSSGSFSAPQRNPLGTEGSA